ncbi:MAG: uroporphyrinogen decarboxylase family protein [Bacillota bacterium]|jgi:hypothetical protein
MEKALSCLYLNDNLPASYLQTNNLNFGELYKNPETLAEHTLKMYPKDKVIINLPQDSYLEAEMFGIKLTGYNQNSALIPIPVPYDQAMPKFNIQHQRLNTILDSLEIIQLKGKTPCLNLSGFASVFDAMYGSTLFYTEWFNSNCYIKEIFAYMADCYLQIIRKAAAKGIKIFSFAEPTIMLHLVGEHFAAEYSTQILLPFFNKITDCKIPLIFHICALTTSVLLQSEHFSVNQHPLTEAKNTDNLLTKLSSIAKKPIFIGNNCINSRKIAKNWEEISFF